MCLRFGAGYFFLCKAAHKNEKWEAEPNKKISQSKSPLKIVFFGLEQILEESRQSFYASKMKAHGDVHERLQHATNLPLFNPGRIHNYNNKHEIRTVTSLAPFSRACMRMNNALPLEQPFSDSLARSRAFKCTHKTKREKLTY